MVSDLAKEAGDASIAGSYRTCSDERYEKNKCSYDNPLTKDMVSLKEPICYGCG